MKTYEDLVNVLGSEDAKQSFIITAIGDHKSSELYKSAITADKYFKRRNVTINEYQKLLYTVSGKAVPDNFSANHKVSSGFFQRFVVQENLHLLGNGVTFNEDGTKEKLGGDEFDTALIRAGEYALVGGVSFGFFNLDHIDIFKVTEFVPLIGEEDGALHAGIRFWQVSSDKPMRITLYEQDGYTDYQYYKGEFKELNPKRTYIQTVAQTAEFTEIIDGRNYPNFPIVPFWGNPDHQSELIGLRSGIDCYDLIKSGFANDLDDASQIYWTITNAGGMDDVDLAKFVERMKTVKAAVVDEAGGSKAEAHTMDVPYNARQAMLDRLRSDLYEDAMALDTKEISGGSITATAINAAYENLSMKCDRYETCVVDFIKSLLKLIGVEDSPTFSRSKIVNMQEDTNMVLASAQYLDEETILKHLPFISPDEIDSIMANTLREETNRFSLMEGASDGFNETVDGR